MFYCLLNEKVLKRKRKLPLPQPLPQKESLSTVSSNFFQKKIKRLQLHHILLKNVGDVKPQAHFLIGKTVGLCEPHRPPASGAAPLLSVSPAVGLCLPL